MSQSGGAPRLVLYTTTFLFINQAMQQSDDQPTIRDANIYMFVSSKLLRRVDSYSKSDLGGSTFQDFDSRWFVDACRKFNFIADFKT